MERSVQLHDPTTLFSEKGPPKSIKWETLKGRRVGLDSTEKSVLQEIPYFVSNMIYNSNASFTIWLTVSTVQSTSRDTIICTFVNWKRFLRNRVSGKQIYIYIYVCRPFTKMYSTIVAIHSRHCCQYFSRMSFLVEVLISVEFSLSGSRFHPFAIVIAVSQNVIQLETKEWWCLADVCCDVFPAFW
jgi:hypothetical protein